MPDDWGVTFKADWFAKELYEQASRPSAFLFAEPSPPLSRWQRWKIRTSLWVDAHWPRVHLGPCDHSDCY